MITAIDTNVISAIWSHEPGAFELASALGRFQSQGALIICAPVYAELSAGPRVGRQLCSDLVRALGIRFDPELSREIWDLAADTFSTYAERRRSGGAGHPRRIMADFLVGAHAQLKSQRLATLDAAFYRSAFPQLALAL